MKIKKYFLVYKEFIRTSASEILSFRLNFALQSIMNLLFMGVFFFTSHFIFNHVEQIGSWNKTQFFFFLSFAFAVDQIHYIMFSANFWGFSEDIRLGKLDFHLLKPTSSLFIVFTKYVSIPGIVSLSVCLGLLTYFGFQSKISVLSWLSLPFCLIISLSLLLALEILSSLLNFLTIEGMGINQARLQIQHFCRWPDFIYKNPLRLFMIPMLAITSFPVRFLLNLDYWGWLLSMAGGTFFLWILILFLWPKSLNLYESPSS